MEADRNQLNKKRHSVMWLTPHHRALKSQWTLTNQVAIVIVTHGLGFVYSFFLFYHRFLSISHCFFVLPSPDYARGIGQQSDTSSLRAAGGKALDAAGTLHPRQKRCSVDCRYSVGISIGFCPEFVRRNV